MLQMGSSDGFAMVFALFIAAILWNLGTWRLGLPASSSHTLNGSILGVGIGGEGIDELRDVPRAIVWREVRMLGICLWGGNPRHLRQLPCATSSRKMSKRLVSKTPRAKYQGNVTRCSSF
jgi:hypothetical protein